MADFKNLSAKLVLMQDAREMLDNFRILYSQAQLIRSLLARYQSDPAFKAEVDYLFTPVQRAELASMIGQVNVILTDWEANHASVLGQDAQS